MTKEITIYGGKNMVKVLRETIKINCDLSAYDESINFKANCITSKHGNIKGLNVYRIGSKAIIYTINFMDGTVKQINRNKVINEKQLVLFEDYDFYKINDIKKNDII